MFIASPSFSAGWNRQEYRIFNALAGFDSGTF
jgi:hypothetical protein